MSSSTSEISYPIPISRVGDHYFLYDLDHISHLREAHNIPGVLIGTLPQSPQQNVFLGLPLQLMPEEARLLVEKGVAYIVDDAAAHETGLNAMSARDRREWREALRAEGLEAAKAMAQQAEDRKAATLSAMSAEKRAKALAGLRRRREQEESAAPPSSSTAEDTPTAELTPHAVTPTLSYPPLQPPPPDPSSAALPSVPSAANYALYRHLHARGYVLTPGLRFGAPYTVYPGDPLRFHSHFLAQGAAWDEPIPLRRIVGGGRLGTGVKKGFLLGGAPPDGEEGDGDGVRCFCVEWAGM